LRGICNSFPGLGTKISSCLLKSAIPLRTSVQFHILQQPDRYRLNPLSIIQCFFISFTWLKFGSTSNRLPPAYPQNKQNAFLYNFAIGSYAVYFLYLFFLWRRNEKWFPKVLLILDLDQSFVNERLNTFNPLKQNTTNKAIAPTMIPILAMRLMMFMALFYCYLECNVWRCKGKFKLYQLAF
jgi:hypothetical protein